MGKVYESSHKTSKTKQNKNNKVLKVANNNISLLAIDTGAFIDLVKLDENYTPKKQEEGFRHSLRQIKRLVMNGNLRLVVTPTALREISAKINAREIDFLTNFCYFVPSLNEEDINLINKTLARVYIAKNYIRHKKDKDHTSDAQILAEASRIGLCLLTENVKDMIDYGKYEPVELKLGGRSSDIANYHLEQKIGGPYPPRPITTETFLANFRSGCYSSSAELEPLSASMLQSFTD